VIRRVDQDEVEVFLGQQLPPVAVEARTLLRHLPRRDEIGRLVQHLAVGVTHRDDGDRRDLDHPQQIRLPVPSGPDDPDALVGANLRGERFVARQP
jgi:hypothetical protein